MSEITVVTGFFDIGRGGIKGELSKYSRSNDKYFSYFSRWARMRNQLVVYTEPEYTERVMEIRRSYGLADKTTVIPVENIFTVEPDIYKRMKLVEKESSFRELRYYREAMSNGADYDYIMLMKYWMMKDAQERGLLSDTTAWIDFGFDHGGTKYIDEDDWDFLWQYDFEDKIHLFSLCDPEKINAWESLQLFPEVIMGAPLTLSTVRVAKLYELVRKAMEALLMLEAYDDDQQLLLMAYKWAPEEFAIHISDWFLPIREYGGSHMKVREVEKPKQGIRSRIRRWYSVHCGGVLVHTERKAYAQRMYELAGRFYE